MPESNIIHLEEEAKEKMAENEKTEEKKEKFEIVVSFIGEYKLDVEAEDFQSAAQMLEGANDSETKEAIEEAIRLEIGSSEINSKLTIYHPDILSINSDD